MPEQITYLPYSDTGHFSRLVIDYLSNKDNLTPFYTFTPDATGLHNAIESRKNYAVDRELLSETLKRQYIALPKTPAVEQNLELLARENTFTVCTAHQPNLLTGYLYFVYKILHAIKLAEKLRELYPDKHFVPVYYMGSEDNDLDELGTFRYEGRKFIWEANGQTGAVGRMRTETLKGLLDELFKLLGPPGENCDELKAQLIEAYLKRDTISEATQYLVNELFGRYGLIILNPDEASFKRAILPVMKEDLLQHTAYSLVSEQIEKLEADYKVQAHPRPINLFYLQDQLRERIEKRGNAWHVVNTNITLTEEELLEELEHFPERFSPNVILRGIFQETILPNVAFIGGGAEVAYWLQLKAVFDHHNVFYPAILLRQSILWIESQGVKLRKQLELSVADIFKPEVELVRQYITKHSNDDWQTDGEAAAMEKILEGVKKKATMLDPTLRGSAEAVLIKIKYQLQTLEKKMLRAEKRKMQTQLQRISRLKANLYPNNNLQERVENFSSYYVQYGHQWFDILKDAIKPLKAEFLVIEANN